jgi:hypothetical protein
MTHRGMTSQEDQDTMDQLERDLGEALGHIEHLLEGPGTHYHSTDTQPGCSGCEGEHRFGEAREFLKKHGRKVDS